jgi:DNA-binding NarL/FixJ family response regulator
MKSDKIRVLIVDDHEVVRSAYRLLIENQGMEVVGEGGSGREAIDAALDLEPDLVLLDISMPDMDGFEALSVIKYLLPDVQVVILTSHEDETYLARAGELGAAGYFSKRVPADELLDAIKQIVEGNAKSGGIQLGETVTAPVVSTLPKSEWANQSKMDFTDQEAVVVSLLSMGHTNEEIAQQLFVTRNTLKTHLRNIYGKLGVSDRTQAAVWAIRNGFAPFQGPYQRRTRG